MRTQSSKSASRPPDSRAQPTLSLWLEITELGGDVRHHRLDLVVAFLRAGDEPAPSRAAQSLGNFLTASHWVGLRPPLLGDGANLSRPLAALLVRDVAILAVLALLLVLSPALGHVVHHQVGVVLGPTLGDVLGLTNLRAGQITVLAQRGEECQI